MGKDRLVYNKDEIDLMIPELPIGKLYYMDYHYKTLLEERMEKIKKICQKFQ